MQTHIRVLVLGVLLAVLLIASGTIDEWRGKFTAGVADATKSECPSKPPREFSHTPYYMGPLFDAHLHLPSSSSIVSSVSSKMGLPTPAWNGTLSHEYVTCMLKSEGTKGAFGFHLMTKYSLSSEVSAAKSLDSKKSGVAHFLMPAFVNSAINPSVESIRKILEKNPSLFKGIGEVKFFDGTSPDNAKAHAYYQLAEKYGLVVMMHPFGDHKEAVSKVVEHYPNVTFLFHGIDGEGRSPGDSGEHDNIGWVMDLLRTFPNVYYSMDDAPMWQPPPVNGTVDGAAARSRLRQDFNSELDRLVHRWKGHIETFPDRFLSGTDRWYGWHYDREASALIIEFKRAFIGKLSPDVQEKYAYKNAEVLLKH